MDKIILHCDLNNFFASVECRDNPILKNYPVAVCGSSEQRHGIVLAKNENAKKFGIKTAEVIWQAKQKCPDLIIVPPHMDKYIEASKAARKIYSKFTDLIEPFGIDECWLDVTGSTLLYGNGLEIANRIRNEIKNELGLTISVGVSFNKVFAKLGSDLKKPDAVTAVSKENYRALVWRLPASDMLGVGRATEQKLLKYGIKTIGDIAKTDIRFLKEILGKNGEALWYFANGKGSDSISHQEHHELIKSIGNSVTCSHDLTDSDEVFKVMYHLAEKISKRMIKHRLIANGIQISVKYTDLTVKETQCSLPFATRYPKDLVDFGIKLFKENYSWAQNVRAVGIRAINLLPEDASLQCSFLYDEEKIVEHDSLEHQIYSLRNRYGEEAVLRASLMNYSDNRNKKYDETSLPGGIFKY